MKNIIKLCLFLLLFNSCNFAPGSYPYAETYKINLSEEELIEVINKFKESNTEYIMGLEYSLTDRRSSHWYHIYFKNLKKDRILHIWVSKISERKTKLAFVSVNKHSVLGSWRRINKDFTWSENRKQIKEFENEILYQLGIDDLIEPESFW
ncbi:MAG: hypothetical protein HRT66_12625 [Flavobacteriaceae bacterium]|nr:hypothetical protein [Flavobacteriaceae bacterium]